MNCNVLYSSNEIQFHWGEGVELRFEDCIFEDLYTPSTGAAIYARQADAVFISKWEGGGRVLKELYWLGLRAIYYLKNLIDNIWN